MNFPAGASGRIWEQREQAGPCTSLQHPEFSLQSKKINTTAKTFGRIPLSTRHSLTGTGSLELLEGNTWTGRAGGAARSQQEPRAPAAASWIPAGSEMLQRWILHPSLWLLEYLHKPQCALNPTTKSSQRAINILIPVAG